MPHGVTGNLSRPVRCAEKITDLVRTIEIHSWPLTSKSINQLDPDCIGDVWNAFHWGGTSCIIRLSTEAIISVSWKKMTPWGFIFNQLRTDEQKLNSFSWPKSKSMKTSFKSTALSTDAPWKPSPVLNQMKMVSFRWIYSLALQYIITHYEMKTSRQTNHCSHFQNHFYSTFYTRAQF